MNELVSTIDSIGALEDVTFMAKSPAEMEKSQRDLILWCQRKIVAEIGLLRDAEGNLQEAKNAKWKSSGWARRVRIATLRVAFYKKVKAALELGYYIVPPFPIDVFAIRTARSAPDHKASDYEWKDRRQSAQALPQGDGRYVSDVPVVLHEQWLENDKEGKPKIAHWYHAEEFQAVDFPIKFAKGPIIEQTRKAMEAMIFDDIGVMPSRPRKDPIVCGRIIHPDKHHEPVTFFVAWWLDTRDL